MLNDLLVDTLVTQVARLAAHLVHRPVELGLVGHLPDLFQQAFIQELAVLGENHRVQAARWDLSLRTIQSKANATISRLGRRPQTILQSVYHFVLQSGGVRRAAILVHFSPRDEKVLAGSLAWLVHRGLLRRGGPRRDPWFEPTDSRPKPFDTPAQRRALAALISVVLHQAGGRAVSELEQQLALTPCDPPDALTEAKRAVLREVVDDLLAQGTLRRVTGPDGVERLHCPAYHLRPNQPASFEAALHDHFEALADGVVARLSGQDDRATGSTWHIAINPAVEAEVVSIVEACRAKLSEVRRRGPPADAHAQMTVYLGLSRRPTQDLAPMNGAEPMGQ